MWTFEGKPQELPDVAYVSLTEAMTWIAFGDCRTDEYIAEIERKEAEKNRREWLDAEGPGYLLLPLDQLRKGLPWPRIPSGPTSILIPLEVTSKK